MAAVSSGRSSSRGAPTLLQALRHAVGKPVRVVYLQGHTATGTLVLAARDGSVTLENVAYTISGDACTVTMPRVDILPEFVAGVELVAGDDLLKLARDADEAAGRAMRPSAAAAVSLSASVRNDTERGAASVGIRALERSLASASARAPEGRDTGSEARGAHPATDSGAEQVLRRPRFEEDSARHQ